MMVDGRCRDFETMGGERVEQLAIGSRLLNRNIIYDVFFCEAGERIRN